MTTRPTRPRRPQVVLEVLRSEWLTDNMIRLFLGGPNFEAFKNNEFVDKYVKIWFAKPELGLEPPYEMDELRSQLAPEDLPVSRTYTVREVNDEERWISLDFVVHGVDGIAAPWATKVQAGEKVSFGGPGGAFNPDPDADWYLFLGDETAMPAIAAALEMLPADAVGQAFIEVDGPASELELTAPQGMHVQWLHRGGAEPGTSRVLVEALRQYEFPTGHAQVFSHGERGAMKELRDVLLKERGLERGQVSLSGYWAYGRTEDKFQAEKREPIGQIFPN